MTISDRTHGVLQVMGVDGLTRENIASHLQKYRRLLEKKAGLPGTGPVAATDWPRLETAQTAHLVAVRKQMEEERRQRSAELSSGMSGKGEAKPTCSLDALGGGLGGVQSQPNLSSMQNAMPQFSAPPSYSAMAPTPQVRCCE